MKKSKLFIFTLLLLIGVLSKSNAQQVATNVRNNFSPDVVLQIFDLVTKTNLSDENQVEIAYLIKDRDGIMYNMLVAGSNAADILNVKSDYDDQITALLNIEQKYSRYVKSVKEKSKDKYSYSQFAIGIRYKDTLALSPIQITAMMSYIDSLKQMKNQHYNTKGKSLDTRAYESEHLAQILTNQQYGQLLIFKNHSKAESFAEQDWIEVQKRGLDSTYTKEIATKQLYDYYLLREALYNRFQHDPIKQKAETRDLYINRPTVLKSLEKARRSPENNTAGSGYQW